MSLSLSLSWFWAKIISIYCYSCLHRRLDSSAVHIRPRRPSRASRLQVSHTAILRFPSYSWLALTQLVQKSLDWFAPSTCDAFHRHSTCDTARNTCRNIGNLVPLYFSVADMPTEEAVWLIPGCPFFAFLSWIFLLFVNIGCDGWFYPFVSLSCVCMCGFSLIGGSTFC